MGERVRSERVVVVGAGVSGLTCGIELLRAGFQVTVVAAELWDDPPRGRADGDPPAPSSPWAAAVWYPYHCDPLEDVSEWGRITREVLTDLAASRPDSGVSMISLDVHLGAEADREERPKFASRDLGPLGGPLYPGCVDGMRLRVPLMDVPRYLRFLTTTFGEMGGTVERRRVESLEPLCEDGVTVVNCSGLGARELSPETDPETGEALMTGVRGQVLRVQLEHPLERWSVALRDGGLPPVYVFPRGRECVLGGSYEAEREEEHLPLSGDGEGPLLPDEERIVRDCLLLEPALQHQLRLGTGRRGGGLRPVRKGGIRLGTETVPGGGRIVHNYGHGGGGFTVSWGCAAEVARRVRDREEGAAG